MNARYGLNNNLCAWRGPAPVEGNGRSRKRRREPLGDCVCPSCGHTLPHEAGKPCNRLACPSCGVQMCRTDEPR